MQSWRKSQVQTPQNIVSSSVTQRRLTEYKLTSHAFDAQTKYSSTQST